MQAVVARPGGIRDNLQIISFRRYALELLESPPDALIDEVVEPRNGDVLLGLDLSRKMLIEAEAAELFTYYRNAGVAVHFIVYDLLPVQTPQCFAPGSDLMLAMPNGCKPLPNSTGQYVSPGLWPMSSMYG